MTDIDDEEEDMVLCAPGDAAYWACLGASVLVAILAVAAFYVIVVFS